MNNMTEAFILLLAGFVVVFSVLIVLIAVVTIYSKIITSIQNAGKKKKEARNKNKEVVVSAPPAKAHTAYVPQTQDEDDGEIPGEIIAVIAAAVDAVYGEKKHRIRSVRKTRASRSAWSRAGVLDNTRPF